MFPKTPRTANQTHISDTPTMIDSIPNSVEQLPKHLSAFVKPFIQLATDQSK